jgi:hypothetical protein
LPWRHFHGIGARHNPSADCSVYPGIPRWHSDCDGKEMTMRETTDGRYVEVIENEWWDTTGTALVDDDEIESYLEANPRVGIMVRETSAEMAERETGSPRLH